MPVDIYLKIPSDPYYDNDQIEVDDDLFNFVQHIEMILTTSKGEVFGHPEMGANLDAYLWNPNVSAATIKSDINRQIFEYARDYASKISYTLDVSFISGDYIDTILVDISIDGDKVLGIAATPRDASISPDYLSS